MDHAQLALQTVTLAGNIKSYFFLTKPRLVVANIISAAGGYFLAAQGHIAMGVFLPLMVGMALVVASGCVLNNYIDKDIDRIMPRTRGRALVTGAVSDRSSLLFALVLGVAGAALLLGGTNLLAFGVAMAGFVVYVLVYSLYLKRNAACSTVIGSLAGAAPPLAAYCAASNTMDAGALIVLGIFSLWQIPHSYAITVFRQGEYAAARVPVMSVKSGVRSTKRQIVWHVAAFVPVTLMLGIFGYAGQTYQAVAAALSLSWLFVALSGYNAADNRLWARRVYLFSIPVIFILSVMMAIDHI